MNKNKTVTTVEQIKKANGVVMQRIATHIVTEFHGYYTLCTEGCNIRYDENNELILDCQIIAENHLPVTCPSCILIWHDIKGFTVDDFVSPDESSDFVTTDLTDISLPTYEKEVNDEQR